jgi:hypothetical protein
MVRGTFGGVTATALADAGASASVTMSSTAISYSATAGALAAVSLDMGRGTKATAFVQALADGHLTLSDQGVVVAASAGVGAGLDSTHSENFSLGRGLSGAETTKLEAEVIAATNTGASIGLSGAAASFGARAGAYVAVGEEAKFELGPVNLDVGATVMSPGVLGVSANIQVGFHDSTLEIKVDVFLGLGLFGVDLNFDIAIDITPVIEGFKEFAAALDYLSQHDTPYAWKVGGIFE